MMNISIKKLIFSSIKICLILFVIFTISSCVSNAASAEECYSMGMAYFELGKYAEAERWLQRATAADKTITASEYNLGRIAFETGRFDEAAKYFNSILTKDPGNVMALKALAFTKIRIGDLEEAESLYNKVLTAVPENADDGYNYALVLFALKKYQESEEVLLKYPYTLDEKPDSLLLLARAQDAGNKVEAVDTYAKWIAGSTSDNPKVLHEYGKVLEKAELYAKALEEYRASLAAMKEDLANLKKSEIRFDISRILLIADPGNPDGILELDAAVKEGFNNKEALEALLGDDRIDANTLNDIRRITENIVYPGEDTEAGAKDPNTGSEDSEENSNSGDIT